MGFGGKQQEEKVPSFSLLLSLLLSLSPSLSCSLAHSPPPQSLIQRMLHYGMRRSFSKLKSTNEFGRMSRQAILGLPSIPAISPSYPHGPYFFRNREYFIVEYKTDINKLKQVVPWPLVPASDTILYVACLPACLPACLLLLAHPHVSCLPRTAPFAGTSGSTCQTPRALAPTASLARSCPASWTASLSTTPCPCQSIPQCVF